MSSLRLPWTSTCHHNQTRHEQSRIAQQLDMGSPSQVTTTANNKVLTRTQANLSCKIALAMQNNQPQRVAEKPFEATTNELREHIQLFGHSVLYNDNTDIIRNSCLSKTDLTAWTIHVLTCRTTTLSLSCDLLHANETDIISKQQRFITLLCTANGHQGVCGSS